MDPRERKRRALRRVAERQTLPWAEAKALLRAAGVDFELRGAALDYANAHPMTLRCDPERLKKWITRWQTKSPTQSE